MRSEAQLDRAPKAINDARLTSVVLDHKVEPRSGHVSVCTMHLAKGVEFRAVVVMACDDEIIPFQERLEQVTDDGDLEEVYCTSSSKVGHIIR